MRMTERLMNGTIFRGNRKESKKKCLLVMSPGNKNKNTIIILFRLISADQIFLVHVHQEIINQFACSKKKLSIRVFHRTLYL
jgi:hypothetical protein